MIVQCKMCGTPLGNNPTPDDLGTHWMQSHMWHKEMHPEMTPEQAILKLHK